MFISTLLDKTYDWLYSTWTGETTLEEIKAAYIQCLQLMRANQTDVLIVDCRRMAYRPDAAIIANWIKEEWFEAAERSGLTSLIHVVPGTKEEGNQMSWPVALGTVPYCRNVENLSQALKWLKHNRVKKGSAV